MTNGSDALAKYPHVFRPIRLRGVDVANRIVMAPMGNHLQDEDGFAGQAMIAYLEVRGRGGAGIVFAPFAAVGPGHSTFRVHSDRALPGLRELAGRIASGGSLPFLQIAHQGANRASAPLGPSAIQSCFYRGPVPREMSDTDIALVTKEFGDAAYRGVASGFAGIEIHAALGYLVGSFCSPHANRRTDKFGGLEGGFRFVEGIVREIRKRCGDTPLGAKINAHEHVQGGIGDAEAARIATAFEEMGFDFLHIAAASTSSQHCEYCGVSPIYRSDHYLARAALARLVKEHAAIPVIADGGIGHPTEAETLLSRGMADMVAVGRAFIADPEWLKHVREGVPFAPCVRCNVCHSRETIEKVAVQCSVNPAAGRELTHQNRPALRSLDVVVVGGGPAGMQAALSSARRGHRVHLYERQESLGGNMRAASVPRFKRPLRAYLEFLIAQLAPAGVAVHLGERVDAARLRSFECDAVILATGSRPHTPEIVGLDAASVLYAASLLDMPKALRPRERAVVIGANKVGCEVAWYIREELGASPVLVDVKPRELLMADEYPRDRVDLLVKIGELGIPLLCGRSPVEARQGMLYLRREAGMQDSIPFDKIVIAAGALADDELERAFSNGIAGCPIVSIGDCLAPRSVYHALQEGFLAAYALGEQPRKETGTTP